ncbi:PPE domain-containing protein [Nocardia brasiliensis]|uniref:PPE domain-containing protein n=1 Tax=Nocardia brasiliensis TaxID=37326 RepID=UPI003D937C30
MDLEVDPAEIIGQAARTHAVLHDVATAEPSGWVLAPGRDSLSRGMAGVRNAEAAGLLNEASMLVRQLQETARKVGASGANYTEGDDSAARILGGGGPVLTNPVPEPDVLGLRHPPRPPDLSGDASVDSLTFARQLRDGHGTEPANAFAQRIRGFADKIEAATQSVREAIGTMGRWQPVGAAAAAEFTRNRDRLEEVGTGLRRLADEIDGDMRSFRDVFAKHPEPDEISATRQNLLTAMRTRNAAAVARARAEFDEQNSRSREAITGYSTALSSGGTSSGGANPSATEMSSLMATLLPAMMSALSSAAPLAQQPLTDHTAEYGDDEYYSYGDDYDGPGLPYSAPSAPSATGVTSGSTSGTASAEPVSPVPVYPAGPMPVTPNPAGQTPDPTQPRAPVIEPLSTSSTAATTARGTTGMPYMPYMPMMPGAGGQAGNERPRVVAWHPDRLMFVDDTPHTEQVIGEQPTITPTVTPPTPPRSDSGPTLSGGSG